MERFYCRAIKALKERDCECDDLVDDIESYVNHLEFQRSLLVDELRKVDTFHSKNLLSRMGYKADKDG